MKKLFKEYRILSTSVPSSLFAIFVAALIAMNLLANKSINLNVSFLALDVGIIFSWVVFLVLDIITKRFGARAANMITVAGLIINLFIALLFFLGSLIPGTWSQSYVEGSESVINGALDATIANTWYVIMGSSIAFVVSAFVNNFLNQFIFRKFKKDSAKSFYISSYVSTIIAQFVDNLLFALIVSLNFFGWTFLQCIMCALTGAVCELLFEVVFSAIGYKVVRYMENNNIGNDYLEYIRNVNELKETK